MPVTINGTTGVVTPAADTATLTVGSITGLLKASSGVVSQAVAGTDYLVGGSSITATNTAKAWVNFNGTTSPGTIRSSYNVSSVTKNGTGDYTITFTTPMSDANYTFTFGGGVTAGYGDTGAVAFRIKDGVAPTSSAIRIVNAGGTLSILDTIYGSVAIFGN